MNNVISIRQKAMDKWFKRQKGIRTLQWLDHGKITLHLGDRCQELTLPGDWAMTASDAKSVTIEHVGEGVAVPEGMEVGFVPKTLYTGKYGPHADATFVFETSYVTDGDDQ